MIPKLKKICDAIMSARDKDAAGGLDCSGPKTFAFDAIVKLADYALRVEKMLEAAHYIEVVDKVDLYADADSGTWTAVDPSANVVIGKDYPDALSAFEATQDVSNGRGTAESY